MAAGSPAKRGSGLVGSFIGNVGGSGSGGRVDVNYRGGTIATTGEAAHGILAQSVGGSTANGSPGKGGDVTVRVGGNIFANGRNANGIMAQSKGLGSNGTVSVTIDPGAIVKGGTGIGAGVVTLDGSNNRTREQRDDRGVRRESRLGHCP